MENFYTILTRLGLEAEAEATGTGVRVLLTEMALGDGGGSLYEPDPEQTELVNEVWRGNLYTLTHDQDNPYQYAAEVLIPADTPSFILREAGLYTDQGVLYAVAKHPVISKQQILSNPGADVDFKFRVKMIFAVSNADTVEITVNTEDSITINDSLVPNGDTGTMSSLLSWLAHMILSITGAASWRTYPAITLADVAEHIADTDNPHEVTSGQVGAAPKDHEHENDESIGGPYFLAGHLPPTTKTDFFQQAPPPGWVLDTAHHNKALRVVSGVGGGFGGLHDLSTPPSLQHKHSHSHHHTVPAPAGTKLTAFESGLPEHSHTISTYQPSGTPDALVNGDSSAAFQGYTSTDPAGGSAADNPHFHASGGPTGPASATDTENTTLTAFCPKYIDVIVCTKSW